MEKRNPKKPKRESRIDNCEKALKVDKSFTKNKILN